MVKVENLTVNYGNFVAVDDISFNIKKGELFAFLGTNGAGKTTSINVLCGLKTKQQGKVFINGKDIDVSLKDIKKDIAIVFQNNVLDTLLTVKENLLTRAKLYELPNEKLKENLDYLVEKLDLKDILNKRYGNLSGGQKRKADVAKALISEPKFLILDEPTTGLDPQTRQKLWQTLLELKEKKGLTILLTTHYMEEAKDADNVVIIHNGKLLAKGSPAVLKAKYAKDILKIYYKEDKVEKLIEVFEKYVSDHCLKSDFIEFHLKYSNEVLKVLNENSDMFNSFEMIKGDMDDVFLAVTGLKDIK